MKAAAFILNPEKEAAVHTAKRLAAWLTEHRVLVMVEQTGAQAMGEPSLSRDEAELARADFAVVMGGDGTLLRAARLLAPAGVPMLPISFGQFGFMTDVTAEGAVEALDDFLSGRYGIEERTMLSSSVQREGKKVFSATALNDVVIGKGPLSRMLRLAVSISGKYISTYAADGLIIATPTGSTAYSLSAGGPLVAPDLAVMIVTPICPHTLAARSLVVSSRETVEVKVESACEDVMLTVDGQIGEPLYHGDTVSIRESGVKTKLITVHKVTFFDKLQTKLRWGDRVG
ncbi:MAG: NAD(+)/NADH kinase [Armatimonadota bacterium]